MGSGSAKLHDTTEAGPWPGRAWTTVDGDAIGPDGALSAKLPEARLLVAFFTVEGGGMVWSSPHVMLE